MPAGFKITSTFPPFTKEYVLTISINDEDLRQNEACVNWVQDCEIKLAEEMQKSISLIRTPHGYGLYFYHNKDV